MANQSKLNNAAYDQLNKDADRILHLIKVQMDNLTLPSCPRRSVRYSNVWPSKRG